VWSANLLINQTRELAYRLKLSKLFIALVLVSLGTSLPELTVAGVAISSGDPGLSLGNIMGSNITNTTLILGMAILINHLRIGTSKTQQNAWLLLWVTGLFVILFWLQIPATMVGSMLVGVAIGVLIWQYVKAVQGRENEDKFFFVHIPQHHVSVWKLLVRTLAGLSVLVLGGILLVESVETLSIVLGITTTALGMTLAALATTLPELVATVIAQRQHEEKIALGNILGSNIYNLAFIGGVTSFNLPHSVKLGMGAAVLGLASLILFAIIKRWRGVHVPKWVGIGLVIGYAVYLIGMLIV
jgi:cation:H+ antiporter